MRSIPSSVTDVTVINQLHELAKQIDEKMKVVEGLKAKMKSSTMSSELLTELKTVSAIIDDLDKKWKSLVA